MVSAEFAAIAKLNRGRRHIDELSDALTEYLASDPVISVGYERRGGPQYQFQMRTLTIAPVPLGVVMIFGDAVHNIRAALDWLINEVVAQRGKPPTDLAFPFAQSPERLGKAIREKMKNTSSAERDIVRSFRPYRGGNEALWSLHELDIHDKHRSPLAVATSVATSPMTVTGIPEAPRLIHSGKTSPVPAHLAGQFAPAPGFECIGVLDDTTREVVIDKTLPMGGTGAISALHKMADAVNDVVSVFSRRTTAQ